MRGPLFIAGPLARAEYTDFDPPCHDTKSVLINASQMRD